MTPRPYLSTGALAALVLVAVSGCGPGKSSVTGTVKYRGKLLVTGTVILAGPDHTQVSAPINPDGTYRIDNIMAGPAQIGVASFKPSATTGRPAKQRAGGAPPRPVDDAGWFEIPDKYADPLTSGLTTELKAGPNDHPIDLP